MRSLWRRFIMLIDGWLYRAEVALNTAHHSRPPHEPTTPAREARHDFEAHLHELADRSDWRCNMPSVDGQRYAVRPPPFPGGRRGN